MRLTKDMRRALVHAVMADVPFVDYYEHQTKLLTEWAVSIMPPSVRKVWDDEGGRKYILVRRVGIHIRNRYITVYAPLPDVHPDLSEELREDLVNLENQIETQSDERRDLELSVRTALEACTTTKQVRTRFPEFEKYLPAEGQVTPNLPATTNLITDLMRAGWTPTQGSRPEATRSTSI